MGYEVRVNGKAVNQHTDRAAALNDACVQLQANLGSPVEVLDLDTGKPIAEEAMKLWCTTHPPS